MKDEACVILPLFKSGTAGLIRVSSCQIVKPRFNMEIWMCLLLKELYDLSLQIWLLSALILIHFGLVNIWKMNFFPDQGKVGEF